MNALPRLGWPVVFGSLLFALAGCNGAPSEEPGADEAELTMTAQVLENATVDSATPNKALGAPQRLEADTWPSVKHALVKLQVSGLPADATVTGATLSLHVVDGSSSAGEVHAVQGRWSASTVTYANAPAVGSKLATAGGSVKAGQTVSFDVASALHGNGVYSFYLVTTSGDGVDFASKATGAGPTLKVTYARTSPDAGSGGGHDGGATPPVDAGTPRTDGGTGGVWPPAQPLLGIYEGDLSGQSDDGKSWTGQTAPIASSYYPAKQPGLNVEQQTARIERGTIPLITLCTQATGYLTGIVNGDAAAMAWLNQYVAALKTLSEVNPNIPVLATLCHEYDVQIGDGQITGVDIDSTGHLLGKALSIFYRQVRASAPRVKVGVWFASSPHTVSAGVLSAMTEKPDWVSSDFYSNTHHAASETLATTWSQFSWIKENADYVRLGSAPLMASEFGSSTTHGDSSVAAYYAHVKDDMRAEGLVAAVMFDRDSGPQGKYKLDDGVGGAMPLAEAAFRASMAAK